MRGVNKRRLIISSLAAWIKWSSSVTRRDSLKVQPSGSGETVIGESDDCGEFAQDNGGWGEHLEKISVRMTQ